MRRFARGLLFGSHVLRQLSAQQLFVQNMMPHPVRQRGEPFVGDFAIPMGLRAQGHDQTDGCARRILAYQAQRRFQVAVIRSNHYLVAHATCHVAVGL